MVSFVLSINCRCTNPWFKLHLLSLDQVVQDLRQVHEKIMKIMIIKTEMIQCYSRQRTVSRKKKKMGWGWSGGNNFRFVVVQM